MVTGCGNKTAITSSDFKTRMEAKGYIVQDATNQFSDYDYITQVYIALSSDYAYQIEFYELSNSDNASSFFNTNKSIFENSKSSSASETSVSTANNAKYTLTTNGQFKVVSRIDNTVIYLNVSESYKSTIKDVLKDLGY
jgi:hypothetical protein